MSIDSAYNCRRSIDAKLRVISGAGEDDIRIFAPAISLAEEAIILGGIDQPAIVVGADEGRSVTGSASTAEPSLINYFNKIREDCSNRNKLATKPNKSTLEPVLDSIETDNSDDFSFNTDKKRGGFSNDDTSDSDIGIVWDDNASVEGGVEDETGEEKLWSDSIQDE